MRLLIDTTGIKFRVAGEPKMRPDYKDREQQARTQDGRLIWTVRLDAVDDERKTKESIFVEVAGDEPRLAFDGFALVKGLTFAPWVGKDGKIKRSFRADVVESAPAGRSVQAA